MTVLNHQSYQRAHYPEEELGLEYYYLIAVKLNVASHVHLLYPCPKLALDGIQYFLIFRIYSDS